MSRTITFTMDTKYEDRITETFTFEQLGIDENMTVEERQKVADEIFKRWVCDKLDISYSIVMD